MIGPWANSSALVVGGFIGALLGQHVPSRIKEALPLTCGVIAMGIGAVLVNRVQTLPAVSLALICGALIGEILFLERAIEKLVSWCQNKLARAPMSHSTATGNNPFVVKFVTIMVLFCASGMGVFGSTQEGMTGDPSILLAKSILDLFTAMIFATELGYAVMAIAIPQFLIQGGLFASAHLLTPLTTPAMLGDFSACGGLIMLATGLRICGIKIFPIVNMLPALVLAMPISALWAHFFV